MPHLPKDKERQIYYHVHYFFGSVRVLLSAKKPTLSNTLFSTLGSLVCELDSFDLPE